MTRFSISVRSTCLAAALAGAALLSGRVVAPIGPRPVVIRPGPVYVEAAPVVIVRPRPPRAYYWHRGQRYWR